MKNCQITLAKYVIALSHQKMNERINHLFSKPFLAGLLAIAVDLSMANYQKGDGEDSKTDAATKGGGEGSESGIGKLWSQLKSTKKTAVARQTIEVKVKVQVRKWKEKK
jgi:hypothetical protein